LVLGSVGELRRVPKGRWSPRLPTIGWSHALPAAVGLRAVFVPVRPASAPVWGVGACGLLYDPAAPRPAGLNGDCFAASAGRSLTPA